MQVSSFVHKQSITIFTDGSCHTQLRTGGWASILFIESKKIILEGSERNTTHQRMELTAVIESLKYLQALNLLGQAITIYPDSQYVVDLLKRKDRLAQADYKTKKLSPIRNLDLVRELLPFMERTNIQFVKIKSHQRLSDNETNFNREVDLLSRKKMRDVAIDKSEPPHAF